MKPYGQEKFYKGYVSKDGNGKTNCHPPKGYVNWWENVCNVIPRSMQKQKIKKEIRQELYEEIIS